MALLGGAILVLLGERVDLLEDVFCLCGHGSGIAGVSWGLAEAMERVDGEEQTKRAR